MSVIDKLACWLVGHFDVERLERVAPSQERIVTQCLRCGRMMGGDLA